MKPMYAFPLSKFEFKLATFSCLLKRLAYHKSTKTPAFGLSRTTEFKSFSTFTQYGLARELLELVRTF